MKTTQTTTTTRRARQQGFALAAVFLVLLLASGIMAAIHAGVLGDTFASGAHHRATNAFYAAEAGINRGMGDYRNVFLSYGIPTGSDYNAHTFDVGQREVTYQLSDVTGNPRQIIIPQGRPFAGLNATEYSYIARSASELTAGEEEASMGTQFNVDYVPLFQFLAFYQNDLEILPGANMNLHGPIHTNGRLYVNSDATLTINELNPNIPTVHVSAAQQIYRGRKNDSSCTGTVRIARLTDANNDGALDLSNAACGGSSAPMSSSSIANWLGALLATQPAVEVPTPDVLERGTGEFWMQADLRIVLDLTNRQASGLVPIVVQDVNGATDAALTARLHAFMTANPGRIFYNDVPEEGSVVGACPTTINSGSYCHRASYRPDFAANADVYRCFRSGLLDATLGCGASTVQNVMLADGVSPTARRGGFYNNREAQWVWMLNVNTRDLLVWNRAQASANRLFDPNDASEGGIVLFLSVAGPGSGGIPSPRYGVRVFGSGNLDFPVAADPTGVTVVSDHAVYVEGNYNVGGGACSHASCPKAPAAIMGDTVNVLSAGWSGNAACRNDCQSRQPLASRPAASTTLNVAFLGGVPNTSVGNYNGGFENYPRFHESWSGGRILTYRGSFVSLGAPVHANGAWCGTGAGCNIYDPPVRNWDYDTDFQRVENLPPITPRFVSVEQILFTENFR